ncbi:hypothetical protein MMC12_008662 [Toensbergia leucococca]|nr:hypothetical protein [Toensbergia leucococca]
MAITASSTSSSSSPTDTSNNVFPGDNFSNNLFTDLAPLLALFGEQMTKRFLSMSMGWADNLLLGLGPVGLLTIVVNTIRVAGSKSLKAIIGRAREAKVSAELELLSSTSADVCEMWTGKEIVRLAVEPKTTEYIMDTTSGEIMSLTHALIRRHLLQGNWRR